MTLRTRMFIEDLDPDAQQAEREAVMRMVRRDQERRAAWQDLRRWVLWSLWVVLLAGLLYELMAGR